MTFSDFNFDANLQEGLDSMGFSKPTPIQQEAIPYILNKHDLIACAQTGTGKTAAYLLPVMHQICVAETKSPVNTLILAPTRELVQQIDQQIEGLAYFTGISSIAVYGGGDGISYEQQRRALTEGVDIIIATPGRLIAHLTSGLVKLGQLQHLILDEADRMLDMGFHDDIIRIISYLTAERQTLLFSATMPGKIRTLANKILKQPEQINIAISQPAVGILQQAYLVFDHQKLGLIKTILKNSSFQSVIIFVSTKEKVKQLHQSLSKAGFNVEAFHSDLEQDQREEILRAFKSRQLPILVGTDVLSRGIDVEGISLVLNYDVPHDPEDYIHRIGRTARAETTGTAITFVNDRDQRKFSNIEAMVNKVIEQIPIPAELGEPPIYEPDAKPKNNNAGRKWQRRKK